MRVIDLLNKIANGEKVPKKIKYENDIYILTDNYCYYCDKNNLIFSDRLYAEQSRLNDEVELLEEEKKIPEKLIPTSLKGIDNLDEKIEIAHIDTISVIETLNKVLDYLKSKGE